MQTTIANLSGDADLRLRGTAAKPALLGRVEVLRRVNFKGEKYRLERGEVLFRAQSALSRLRTQATTRVRDYDTLASTASQQTAQRKYRPIHPCPKLTSSL
jgi:translocation and assembly module TamB